MRSLRLHPALLPLLVLANGISDSAVAGGITKTKVGGEERQVSSPPCNRHRHRSAATAASGQIGTASYYQHGHRVASGARFNPSALTAAHRSLPFGTRVRVTHLGSGRSVEVRINDRGPFVAGRIIDLSKAAAEIIGMTASGVARVSMTVLGR
jgi:peptidoglycan lytic transglycosylase